jgi:hypothetical protein
MSFFLGKSQKIFQVRFTEGTPIGSHAAFFKWAIPSVLLVQMFPWAYAVVSDRVLERIYTGLLSGSELGGWPWGKIFLVAPIVLIVGYAILFWSVRGVKAIKFLAKYKVKPS